MSRSTSEVGHAKNVANFNALIQLLQEMGPMYNPTNPAIQIGNLEQLRNQLEASLQNLADKTPPFRIAVANRENAFEPLSMLSTRIKSSFKSLGLTKAENDNVAALVKKIRGYANTASAENLEQQASNTISTSQQSYTSRAANLQSLISLLHAYPDYLPNETELTLSSLNDLYLTLKNHNDEAANKTFALITARKERNDLLYNNPVNLMNLVGTVKNYIKSVQGAKDYYKAAVALKFKAKTD